jgi:very-short-patch-repair endonuclease
MDFLNVYTLSILQEKKISKEEFKKKWEDKYPDMDFSQAASDYVIDNTHGKLKTKVFCKKHNRSFDVRLCDISSPLNIMCEDCKQEKRDKRSNDDFIRKMSIKYPYYDFSKTYYNVKNKYVIITCPKHGDFPYSPKLMMGTESKDTLCPKCREDESKNTILANFIKKAKEKYPNECNYESTKIKRDYKGYGIKYIATMECVVPSHGFFECRLDEFLVGKRHCQKCRKERELNYHIHDFLGKYESKFPNIDFSLVNTEYVDVRTPITFICKKHGEFIKKPRYFDRAKFPCPFCQIEAHRGDPKEFIERAKEIFPEYDYSEAQYITNTTKIKLKCPIHGSFKKTASALLMGRGCQLCSDAKRRTPIYTEEEAIEKMMSSRPDLIYDRVRYQGIKVPVLVGCKEHGYFLKTPDVIIHAKTGCPMCCKYKGEMFITNWFLKNGFIPNKDFIAQSKFQDLKDKYKLSYDFLFVSKRILIEFNGEQHYKPVKAFDVNNYPIQVKHDNIKKKYAEENGYRLLEIPYTELSNIGKILDSVILKDEWPEIEIPKRELPDNGDLNAMFESIYELSHHTNC